MKVSIREFRAHLSRMLDEKLVEITRNGKIIGVYTKLIKEKKSVHNLEENNEMCTQSDKIPEKSVHNDKNVYTISTYGCGCKKVEGKILCPKHKRQ